MAARKEEKKQKTTKETKKVAESSKRERAPVQRKAKPSALEGITNTLQGLVDLQHERMA